MAALRNRYFSASHLEKANLYGYSVVHRDLVVCQLVLPGEGRESAYHSLLQVRSGQDLWPARGSVPLARDRRRVLSRPIRGEFSRAPLYRALRGRNPQLRGFIRTRLPALRCLRSEEGKVHFRKRAENLHIPFHIIILMMKKSIIYQYFDLPWLHGIDIILTDLL